MHIRAIDADSRLTGYGTVHLELSSNNTNALDYFELHYNTSETNEAILRVKETLEAVRYFRSINLINRSIDQSVDQSIRSINQGRYTLIMTASDGGRPPLSAVHRLDLIVMAERDKYPVFRRLHYLLRIPENSPFPIVFEEATATVADGQVQYDILMPQQVP